MPAAPEEIFIGRTNAYFLVRDGSAFKEGILSISIFSPRPSQVSTGAIEWAEGSISDLEIRADEGDVLAFTRFGTAFTQGKRVTGPRIRYEHRPGTGLAIVDSKLSDAFKAPRDWRTSNGKFIWEDWQDSENCSLYTGPAGDYGTKPEPGGESKLLKKFKGGFASFWKLVCLSPDRSQALLLHESAAFPSGNRTRSYSVIDIQTGRLTKLVEDRLNSKAEMVSSHVWWIGGP